MKRLSCLFGFFVLTGVSVAEPVIDNTPTRVQTPLCVAMRQIGTLHPKAEGFRVLKVKTAYYAIQNAVSVFNDDFESLAEKSTFHDCGASSRRRL